MISKINRFHGQGSLNHVYRFGKTVRSQHLAIKYIRSKNRKNNRFAVVVSKKVEKSAVRRNRIRRRIYGVVRLLNDQMNEPYDMVFTVFSEQLAHVDAEELKKTIESQLKQANIITKK